MNFVFPSFAQLLIAEENEMANEADYRKALELLVYVEDAIDVRHKIWCSAILRDNWSTYNINSPQEDLQSMMFFKLIDLCFFMGELISGDSHWVSAVF